MKKLFLVGALALFGALSAQAGFKVGANVGLPLGDAKNANSFVAGVDLAYLMPVSADFNAGLVTGYELWVGKDQTFSVPMLGDVTVKGENSGMIPIAASGQYRFTPEFSLTVDLGYAFFTQSGAGGGFYYAPKAAYHFGPSEVNVSYRGVSQKEGTASSINLGYAYSFGK